MKCLLPLRVNSYITEKSMHMTSNKYFASFESLLLNRSYLSVYVDIFPCHNSHCIEINALIQSQTKFLYSVKISWYEDRHFIKVSFKWSMEALTYPASDVKKWSLTINKKKNSKNNSIHWLELFRYFNWMYSGVCINKEFSFCITIVYI